MSGYGGGEDLHVRHVHEMHLWSMEQAAVMAELKLNIQLWHGPGALVRMEMQAEQAALEGRRDLSKV